ncbi:helix-turn-helix domain-containing protein [Psychromarinibacter sp. C21-152]|uniref:Helix-turn-helix domain-containing protein n=1 Tax=Psychromarinibacter sediminicola TaxID=3033385 RepID=A0AAE3NRH4_9RHOB|nr:helix-turn-helix domain-containing protein [Psychromarinibacter sediminicola]MDF0600314.1 helix-turn-helix domain-containing protein [Psychromarinibacter sediminicola]
MPVGTGRSRSGIPRRRTPSILGAATMARQSSAPARQCSSSAHLPGTRQESISRAFHALADAGAIALKTPYLVEIRDIDLLAEESGEDYPTDIEVFETLAGGAGERDD